MTEEVGESWREVFAQLGCSPDAHEAEDDEQRDDVDDDTVTGVTLRDVRTDDKPAMLVVL